MSLRQNARLLESAMAPKPVRNAVDWGCIERLQAYAAMRRAELGEARWVELQREWGE